MIILALQLQSFSTKIAKKWNEEKKLTNQKVRFAFQIIFADFLDAFIAECKWQIRFQL